MKKTVTIDNIRLVKFVEGDVDRLLNHSVVKNSNTYIIANVSNDKLSEFREFLTDKKMSRFITFVNTQNGLERVFVIFPCFTRDNSIIPNNDFVNMFNNCSIDIKYQVYLDKNNIFKNITSFINEKYDSFEMYYIDRSKYSLSANHINYCKGAVQI